MDSSIYFIFRTQDHNNLAIGLKLILKSNPRDNKRKAFVCIQALIGRDVLVAGDLRIGKIA